MCQNLHAMITNEPIIKSTKRKFHEMKDKHEENIAASRKTQLGGLPDIYPVLGDEFYRLVSTEKMFVGKVHLKKETSRLIKELSVLWPLEGKLHLKRVRWTNEKDIFEILLRSVRENEMSNHGDSYPLSSVLQGADLNITGLMDDVTIYEVPKFPALTFKQFKEASKFWPVQFREDKYVEKVLKDELFTALEKSQISSYLRKSLEVSQYGDENVGCVIVDPGESKIVAIALDRRHQHPIQHAVMVAIELVAQSQGGCSWEIDSEHTYHLPYSKDDMENKMDEIKKSNPDKDTKKMCLPYLCTGYDAYVSREPCVMCAMALVHSRIRRVFYKDEVRWGALGSHCKLHLQQGLNHHYEVFRVNLNDSDSSALNEPKKTRTEEDSSAQPFS